MSLPLKNRYLPGCLSSLIGIVTCFVLAGVFLGNRGVISLEHKASRSNGALEVLLLAKNPDTLDLTHVVLYVTGDPSVEGITLLHPKQGEMIKTIYEKNNEFIEFSFDFGSQSTISGGEDWNIAFAVHESQSTNLQLKFIQGHVSYVGAIVWDAVAKGQRHSEGFNIPVD